MGVEAAYGTGYNKVEVKAALSAGRPPLDIAHFKVRACVLCEPQQQHGSPCDTLTDTLTCD